MNATPGEEPIQILLGSWSNATDDPPAPTIPADQPTSRIDYIFHRPAGAFSVKEAKVLPESVASDHRPVFAELEIADGE